MKIWKILFNPIAYYSEKKLLVFGILSAVIGAILAYATNSRHDSFLHLSTVSNTEWWYSLVDLVTIMLIVFVFLFVAGKIVNTKTRAIDILNTILVAYIPFYLVSLTNINGRMDRAVNELMEILSNSEFIIPTGTMIYLIVTGFISVLILIWVIALLYNGFKTAANAKGVKAIILFVLALILSTVLTNFTPII